MNKLKIYAFTCFFFFVLFYVGLCAGSIYYSSQESKLFLALFFYFNTLFWLFLCVLGCFLYFK
ncbi:hypothetical protein, partial [Candidatus Phytoplasma sp. AldY-WA1]|uniref:hypothetical protein n=1 Tax=Candidatus Phytoplasma sp. AldY-WA1 TaxID=2852100 RepID=UPI002551069F